MRLQVLSDLHFELNGLAVHDIGSPTADVVVLAGDVDRGGEGVVWAAEMWPDTPIVYVLGNHEFYGHGIESTLEQCRAKAAGTQVQVLENEAAVIGGVRFLGATLWTDFALFGGSERMKMAREVACERMADYRAIRRRERERLRPEDTQGRHRATVDWLEEELSRSHDGPSVVITHHAPHPLSVGLQTEEALDASNPHFIHAAYASDLAWLVDRYQPTLWIHGHTHRGVDYGIGSARVVSNPRGYFMERTGWDREFTVDV